MGGERSYFAGRLLSQLHRYNSCLWHCYLKLARVLGKSKTVRRHVVDLLEPGQQPESNPSHTLPRSFVMHADEYGKSNRQRHPGSRPAPFDPLKDRTHTRQDNAMGTGDGAEEIMFETPANAYKVGATTDVRELASTITQACHGGDMPALLTIGSHSINQAVKGIAAAAADLKQFGELTFQPAFRHTNRTKPLIAFYLARHRVENRPDNGEVVELTATSNQKIVSLAGAIAGKVREGKRTHLLAVGAEAVTNAVLAIGNARLFLEQNSMDIKIAPEFTKITKNSTQINAIRLNIIPEKIA